MINYMEEKKTPEGSSQKKKEKLCSNCKVVTLLSKKGYTLTILGVIFSSQ